jgi:hypothetical protein
MNKHHTMTRSLMQDATPITIPSNSMDRPALGSSGSSPVIAAPVEAASTSHHGPSSQDTKKCTSRSAQAPRQPALLARSLQASRMGMKEQDDQEDEAVLPERVASRNYMPTSSKRLKMMKASPSTSTTTICCSHSDASSFSRKKSDQINEQPSKHSSPSESSPSPPPPPPPSIIRQQQQLMAARSTRTRSTTTDPKQTPTSLDDQKNDSCCSATTTRPRNLRADVTTKKW